MAQTIEGAIKIAAKKAGLSVEQYKALIDQGSKKCSECKEWRPASEFGTDQSRYDGLDTKCCYCRRVKVRKSWKGRVSAFKGRTHTEEAKLKMSKARKGRPSPRQGKPHSEATKAKISKITRERTPRAKQHYAYKHGQAQRAFNDRRRPEYADWRKAVFERDNYTCQKCGDKKGGNLRAHHIKSFAKYPELRFDVNNGITFCHTCHELEHLKPESIRNVRKLKRGEKLWK